MSLYRMCCVSYVQDISQSLQQSGSRTESKAVSEYFYLSENLEQLFFLSRWKKRERNMNEIDEERRKGAFSFEIPK